MEEYLKYIIPTISRSENKETNAAQAMAKSMSK